VRVRPTTAVYTATGLKGTGFAAVYCVATVDGLISRLKLFTAVVTD
jgi:hypothetical protein